MIFLPYHLYYISVTKKSKYFFEKSSLYTNTALVIRLITQNRNFLRFFLEFFVTKGSEMYNFGVGKVRFFGDALWGLASPWDGA